MTLGVDARMGSGTLAGVSVSHAIGLFDYVSHAGGMRAHGEYDLRMSSMRPYLIWEATPETSMWASLGYGHGRIKVEDDLVAGMYASDVSMRSVNIGANRILHMRADADGHGRTMLVLKGEAFGAWWKIEGNGGTIDPLTVAMQQFRLGIEGSHARMLNTEEDFLKRWWKLSVRRDGGDADTSHGVEMAAGLRHADLQRRLTMAAQAHALLAHEQSDYEEYGISLLVRKESEPDGRGMFLLLESGWGALYDDPSRQESGLMHSEALAASEPSLSLAGSFGYGVLVPSAKGLIAGFGEFEHAGDGCTRLRLGVRYAGTRASSKTLRFAVFGEHESGAARSRSRVGITVGLAH